MKWKIQKAISIPLLLTLSLFSYALSPPPPTGPEYITFGKDSNTLKYINAYERRIQTVDSQTGKRLSTVNFSQDGEIIGFSPDGLRLITADYDTTNYEITAAYSKLSIINSQTGETLRNLSLDSKPSVRSIPDIFFSTSAKNGSLLLADELVFDKVNNSPFHYTMLHLINTYSGKTEYSFRPAAITDSYALSPDGLNIAMVLEAQKNKTYVLSIGPLYPNSKKQPWQFTLPSGYNNKLLFSPDGKHLLILTDNQVLLANTTTQTVEKLTELSGKYWGSLFFTANTQKLLAIPENNSDIYRYDIRTKKVDKQSLNIPENCKQSNRGNRYGFSPDKRLVAIGHLCTDNASTDDLISILDAQTGTLIRTLTIPKLVQE